MQPLRDGDRYVPRPREVGPFTLDGPTWSKRGWNLSGHGRVVPGSYESLETALLACGALLLEWDYTWGALHELRRHANWQQERLITVADLVEVIPRKAQEPDTTGQTRRNP